MNKNNYKKILTILFGIILFFPSTSSASLVNKTISQTLTSGLVGHWTMDQKDATWSSDTVGTILDKSGNGYTGTFTNMSRAISQVAGKIGQGVKFNGTDDYVDTSNEILGTYDSFTVSFWAKVETGEGGNFINRGSDGFGNGWSMAVALSPGSVITAATVMQGAQQTVTSSGVVAANTWTYVTFVVSQGNYLKIYRNGVLEGTTNTTSTGLRTSTVGIRFCLINGGYCKGTMDDARIYNRVLSATEISQLYQLSASKFNATSTQPLTSGLVGHWTFDGKDSIWSDATTGSFTDRSGNGNTGSDVNMERATATVAGKIGQGVKFDGLDEYITAPNSLSLLNATITMSVWVKPVVGQVGNFMFISDASRYARMAMSVNSFGTTLASSFNTSGNTFNPPTLNAWNHIVGIFNFANSTYELYINGVLQTAGGGSAFGANTTDNNVYIGARPGPGYFLNGAVDDARIYNRALSATEVSQLYNLGATKFNATPTQPLTSGLVGHWTMDGKDAVWTSSTTGTVVDKSGNGNTGTFTNMARATASMAGKIGQGINLDGADDYLTDSSFSDSTMTAITQTAWVKLDSFNADGYNTVISRNDGGNRYADLHIKSNGKLALYVRVAGNLNLSYDGTGSNTLSTGRWYFVALTYNSSQGLIGYVNGDQDASVSANGNLDSLVTNSYLFIGNNTASAARYVDGVIDDVRIYNRALSATEIQQLYNMGR